MRASYLSPVLGLLLTVGIARGETALKALEALPKGEAQRLAAVVAQDGAPAPTRWHFLVYDPLAPHGVMEYVVADGRILAARGISQFAQTLQASDVFGSSAMVVDSNRIGQIALEYARASSFPVYLVSYQLRKGAPAGEPVWTVTCQGEKPGMQATVLVTADRGEIVGQSGFRLDPIAEANPGAANSPPPTTANRVTPPSPVDGGVDSAVIESDREFLERGLADIDTPRNPIARQEERSKVRRQREVPRRIVREIDEEELYPFDGFDPGIDAAEDWEDEDRSVRLRGSRSVRLREPDPGRVVRRATAPVRDIIRRIIPF